MDSFVGRERELSELTALLRDNRLVTLVGPAGVGKTRLAVEVLVRRSMGVTIVRLANVTRGDEVRRAFVDALDARGGHAGAIVVDNCEHVLDHCGELLGSFLASHPDLRFLVTSRERLRLPGEVVYPVGSMPLGSRSDAVRLFVDRARAADPEWRLSAGQPREIAAICARLDGLPLAIELAASLVRPLPLTEIHARLDERFSLLTGGWRTAERRHRSLREAIAWSYELLSPDEQAVFRRLSVCSAGFGLDAVTALGLDVELVMNLEAKSLITAVRREGAARFRMLESIRYYAREQLIAHNEETVSYEALVAWLARLAAPLLSTMILPYEVARRLRAEHDNVVHVLEWLAGSGDDRQLLLAVAASAVRLHHGHPGDIGDVLASALRSTSHNSAYRGLALGHMAIHTAWAGRHEEAMRLAADAVRLERARGSATLLGRALRASIQVLMAQGDTDGVITVAIEALELSRRLGESSATVLALDDLAWHALERGELDEAAAVLAEALPLCPDIDAVSARVRLVHTAGAHALLRGNHDEAREHFERSLVEAGEHPQDVANALDGLGVAAIRAGRPEHGLRLIAAAENLALFAHTERARWWLDLVAAARTAAIEALPGPTVDAAIAWGHSLRLDEATAFALDGASATAAAFGLSRRETEVTRLVAAGMDNRQIANRLHLSVRTVEDHVRRGRAKLGLRNRAELMAWAARRQG
ncbi:LuxR C-terminal-related transcriptional regulator [Lentzea sp. NBRC 105346]|uniref:ATP-binding protein n=1 Tax=Lentzea sp. NBRC 105346 TaxID=3032205 RepID=UPI0025527670|nr:LuxR C-terminal-related transcriptional regulator [Lentzea sp. NBRC 105346]